MRKIIFTLLTIGTFSLSSCAQSIDSKQTSENNSDYRDNLNLTSSQREKMKEINRGMGARYEAIGRDNTLSGQEKGIKKRELSLQREKEILEVLTPEQREKWNTNDRGYNHGNNRHSNSNRNNQYNRGYNNYNSDKIDEIEDRIDRLEDKYDDEKDRIEDNRNLSKSEIKAQKEALEKKFKKEKAELKAQKQRLKDS